MTPTPDQLRRTHAKAWLGRYATPAALRELHESMFDNTEMDEAHPDLQMIRKLYQTLTGEELPR